MKLGNKSRRKIIEHVRGVSMPGEKQHVWASATPIEDPRECTPDTTSVKRTSCGEGSFHGGTT